MNQNQRILSSKTMFRGELFRVSTLFITLPDGRRTTREIAERRPSVGIIAIDGKKNVLFIREYSIATQRVQLSLPTGMVEDGEKPLAAARRELRQETGYAARKWTKLFSWEGGGSWLWPRTIYLARQLVPKPLPPDGDERITLRPVPVQRALRLAIEGKLESADTGLGIIRAYELIRRKKLG